MRHNEWRSQATARSARGDAQSRHVSRDGLLAARLAARRSAAAERARVRESLDSRPNRYSR